MDSRPANVECIPYIIEHDWWLINVSVDPWRKCTLADSDGPDRVHWQGFLMSSQ